jgi:hypothetical protein
MHVTPSLSRRMTKHLAGFAGAALRTAIHEDIARLRREHATAQRQTAAQELAANRKAMAIAQNAISTVLAQRPVQPISSASGGGLRRPAEALPLRVSLLESGRQHAGALGICTGNVAYRGPARRSSSPTERLLNRRCASA